MNDAITVISSAPSSPPNNLGNKPRAKYKLIGPGAAQSMESNNAIKFAVNAIKESDKRNGALNGSVINAPIIVNKKSTNPIADAK